MRCRFSLQRGRVCSRAREAFLAFPGYMLTVHNDERKIEVVAAVVSEILSCLR